MFKELREEVGKTQAELACTLSIDQTTVSKWETGKSVPKLSMIPEIAAALGVSIETVVLCFRKKEA